MLERRADCGSSISRGVYGHSDRVVAWQLTKRAALHREAEKAKPNCVGAAFLAVKSRRGFILGAPEVSHFQPLSDRWEGLFLARDRAFLRTDKPPPGAN